MYAVQKMSPPSGRVIGAALQPAALETLPWVLFPSLAVPAFAILHLTALLVFARREAPLDPRRRG